MFDRTISAFSRFTPWLLLVGACVALPAQAMSEAEARQLVSRTGFGVRESDLKALESQNYDHAADALVAAAAREQAAITPQPEWVNEPLLRRGKFKDADPDEKKMIVRQIVRQGFELQGWWMQEIVNTPQPLAERMTLFWHDHFTSSLQKVKSPQLLYHQNLLLRANALGNFRTLLHAVAHDAAMIVYLDNVSNRDSQPNENFARELLELFTLGEGHYTEDDVKQAARAFTGWALNRDTGEFREVRFWHDGGEKTFLGEKGDFDGDDILDILLTQPQPAREVSELIVGKLWREFVSATPDPQQVASIAAGFRRNWEIAPVVAALLKTPQFRDPANRGTLTKSPVELVAGALRSFQVPVSDGRFPAFFAARLGQALFNPPNVKGWPGGDAWINSATLVGREQFLESLSRGFNGAPIKTANEASPEMRDEPQAASPQGDLGMDAGKGENKAAGVRGTRARQLMNAVRSMDIERYFTAFSENNAPAEAVAILLPIPPVAPPAASSAEGGNAAAEHLRALLLDPAYQLK